MKAYGAVLSFGRPRTIFVNTIQATEGARRNAVPDRWTGLMAHLWITWKSLIAWLTPERLLLGLVMPAMMILAVTIPPFYAPDEPAHFKRVEGIAAGEILPQTYPAKNGQPFAGAMLDASVPQITSSFIPIEPPLVFSRTRLSTVQNALALRQTGRLRAVAFSNTAIYAPFLYLPSVFAVTLGNLANSSVLLTLYSARIANVLMSVALLVLAARIAPQLAGYVVCCSTIPMMEFQSSVVSADAIILPLFVLFACQCWNMQRNVQERPWLFAVVTLLVAAAKVAYIPFAVLPVLIALVRDRKISARVLFFACTSLVTVGVWMLWAILVRSSVFSMRSGVVINPTQQLAHVVAHPVYFIRMAVQQFDIEKGFLGSRLVQSQKATAAARWTAAR